MSKRAPVFLAAIEGGGTTFVLVVAILHTNTNTPRPQGCIPHTNFEIVYQMTVPSSQSPGITLSRCASFFQSKRPQNGGYAALGICSFGPLHVDRSRPDLYGRISASCPKKAWRYVDVLSPMLTACSLSDLEVPRPLLAHRMDTDVNAPAYAEFAYQLQFDPKLTYLAYVTVGTGVGVGLVINSLTVHGLLHPEAGHVPIVGLNSDGFRGYKWGGMCPYGGKNTVEGVTSSVALTEHLWMKTTTISREKNPELRMESLHGETEMEMNTNINDREVLKDLLDNHDLWDHASNALANLCVVLILVLGVERIAFGGGVMNRSVLYEKIRERVEILLNRYIEGFGCGEMTEGVLRKCIGPPAWTKKSVGDGQGNRTGLVGALELARIAYCEEEKEKSEYNSKVILDGMYISTSGVKDMNKRAYLPFIMGVLVGVSIAAGFLTW